MKKDRKGVDMIFFAIVSITAIATANFKPGPIFRLGNRQSNLCLYFNYSIVYMPLCDPKQVNEQWTNRLDSNSSHIDTIYQLEHKNSHKCLQDDVDTNISCGTCDNTSYQRWELIDKGILYFRLRNAGSDRCLYVNVTSHGLSSVTCDRSNINQYWSFFVSPQNITINTSNWITYESNPAMYVYDGYMVSLMGELRWANAEHRYMGSDGSGQIGLIDNSDAWPRYTQFFMVTNNRALAVSIEIRTTGVISMRSWTVPTAFYTNSASASFYYTEQTFFRCNRSDYECAPAIQDWNNTFKVYEGDGTRSWFIQNWLQENMNYLNLDGLTYVSKNAFDALENVTLLRNLINNTEINFLPYLDAHIADYCGTPCIYCIIILSIGVLMSICNCIGIIIVLKIIQKKRKCQLQIPQHSEENIKL